MKYEDYWEDVRKMYPTAARIIEEECIDDIKTLKIFKRYITAHLNQNEIHEDLNLIDNYK